MDKYKQKSAKKYYSGYIDSDRKRGYSEQPYRGKYFSVFY